MSVTKLTTNGPPMFSGLSGDDKPTTGLGILSKFWETDTGLMYTWTGSKWGQILGPIGGRFILDPSDPTRQGKFDPLVSVPVMIDTAHHKIHEGHSYNCEIVSLSLASAAVLSLAFKTPVAPIRIHMLTEFITLTGGHVEILRSPTWTAETGSAETIINEYDGEEASAILENKGQAGFVANGNMVGTPTALAGGTVIHTHYAFGLKNRFGGERSDRNEIILIAGTQYAVRFTSDAASNKVQLNLHWYEHTDE